MHVCTIICVHNNDDASPFLPVPLLCALVHFRPTAAHILHEWEGHRTLPTRSGHYRHAAAVEGQTRQGSRRPPVPRPNTPSAGLSVGVWFPLGMRSGQVTLSAPWVRRRSTPCEDPAGSSRTPRHDGHGCSNGGRCTPSRQTVGSEREKGHRDRHKEVRKL